METIEVIKNDIKKCWTFLEKTSNVKVKEIDLTSTTDTTDFNVLKTIRYTLLLECRKVEQQFRTTIFPISDLLHRLAIEENYAPYYAD